MPSKEGKARDHGDAEAAEHEADRRGDAVNLVCPAHLGIAPAEPGRDEQVVAGCSPILTKRSSRRSLHVTAFSPANR